MNGAGSYPFVVYVEDNAESGKGTDVFKISLPTYPYSNGAILSGGNIQILKQYKIGRFTSPIFFYNG